MDVRRGHCWRCEQPIGGVPVYRTLCWIAVYCSQVCLASDLFRHNVPECEVWGPKQCSNSTCGAIGHVTKFLEVKNVFVFKIPVAANYLISLSELTFCFCRMDFFVFFCFVLFCYVFVLQ